MRRLFLALSLLLALASPCAAKIQLDIDVGWNNQFRPGKWTPLYVTLADNSPHQVDLELYCPTDRRYAMVVRQGLTIGPTPVTVALYVPLSYQLDETSITIRDSGSGRRLETQIVSDFPVYGANGTGPQPVDPDRLFIGVSGDAEGARTIATQFGQAPVTSSYLAPSRLPAVTVGYDAIDLLMLNEPDFNRINAEQQRAIADWVRAGGILVLWPGAGPMPIGGPLMEMLPARIGENRVFDVPQASLRKAGLPDRFNKIKGRVLSEPAGDAKPIALFPESELTGYRRWIGLGQVVLLPANASYLQFHDAKRSLDFWRNALRGVASVPAEGEQTANQPYYRYGFSEDAARSLALRQALDWIGDIPGAGKFGFSYVAWTLIAMMLIVGPVDWFVLRATGKQPWTWVTITGWIGLITFSSIYLGHIFKSGEVYYRSASLVDEAGGTRVASIDLAGIYSPQTTRYALNMNDESWWRPAGSVNMYGGGNMRTEIDCHQDFRGNRLLPLLINVWNVRFLEGAEFSPAGPMLQASLSKRGDHIVGGSITNRAPFKLTNIRLRTHDGILNVPGEIEPGATLEVGGALDGGDKSLVATTQVSDQDRWQMYQKELPTSRPTATTLNGVGDLRARRIDQQLRDRDDIACVYADYEAALERLTLDVEGAKEAHFGAVRAVVPLAR